MRVLNIPAIAEFVGGNRTYQVKMSIVLSTNLFNKLQTAGNYTWEDLPLNTDIPKLINEYMSSLAGEDVALITDDIHMYLGIKSGDTLNSRLTYASRYFGLNIDYINGLNDVPDFNKLSKLTSLNGFEFPNPNSWYTKGYASDHMFAGSLAAFTFGETWIRDQPLHKQTEMDIQIIIVPEDIFDANGNIDVDKYYYSGTSPVSFAITAYADGEHFETGIPIQYDDPDLNIYLRYGAVGSSMWNDFKNHFSTFSLTQSGAQFDDPTDPYNIGGSGFGGGDGNMPSGGIDDIDPAEIPGLPAISAANLGFITMYNPTSAQIKSLSDFMWSNAFDLITYKKLFSDPMQSIIGLAIVPVAPTIGGSKNVKFGNIDSGINMSYLSTNYVQLDCGSVEMYKYVGCFMDFDPYTKIQIYLPFIGFRQLSADDIIGGSIKVVYNIDVLTGACAAFIRHSSRGVLYSYNGSCITNVPLTSVNFSGAIQNAVSAIGSMLGMAAGMATGAAPLTAMSAMGLMTSAANSALNSKPQVQRSGNLGGSAGILSVLKPYVIIERPNMSVPSNVAHYVGQTCNVTMNLGTCSGFTMCEYVHLDDIPATADELIEIESLLRSGVIL